MRVLVHNFMLLVCFLSLSSFSGKEKDGEKNDNQNYLQVNTNLGLNFSCATPSDLENPQTISNAITLTFKSKKQDCSMHVKVSAYNIPKGADPNNIPLELLYASDNSPNAANIIRTVALNKFDQQIFMQPARAQTFHFKYDLRLKALGYDFPSGHYNFVLLFTMTQP